MAKCPNCDGCGRVTTGGVPWTAWMELPVQSAMAVMMGMVKPEQCPECLGMGYPAMKPVAEMLSQMGYRYNAERTLYEPKGMMTGVTVPLVLDVVLNIARQLEDGARLERPTMSLTKEEAEKAEEWHRIAEIESMSEEDDVLAVKLREFLKGV